jgi:hypothetical protein
VLKKFFKVLGIVGLTIVGLLGIVALYASDVELRVPVDLGGDGKVHVDGWDRGYVSAKGTWVIDGERHAYPLNISDITCWRDSQLCYVADAHVSERGSNYLDADVTLHDIKRWDASTIEYTDDAVCTTYSYVIDRTTQKIIGRRFKKDNATDELCGPTSADLRLSLVKGWDVVQALRRERAPNTISIIVATAFVLLMLAWGWRVIRKA